MRTVDDRYGTKSRVKTHNGETVKRERAPTPTKTQKQVRDAKRATEGAVAMAEHEERETAKRVNMERLKAERLARERK